MHKFHTCYSVVPLVCKCDKIRPGVARTFPHTPPSTSPTPFSRTFKILSPCYKTQTRLERNYLPSRRVYKTNRTKSAVGQEGLSLVYAGLDLKHALLWCLYHFPRVLTCLPKQHPMVSASQKTSPYWLQAPQQSNKNPTLPRAMPPSTTSVPASAHENTTTDIDDTASLKSVSPTGTAASSGTKRKRVADLKYYSVRVGHRPGIYYSWSECLRQVKGFRNATCTIDSHKCISSVLSQKCPCS